MKKDTPMKKLKTTLTEIKNKLQNDFKVLEHVKSRSKSLYHVGVENVGVKGDYTLVFQDKKTKKSFAFAFSYVGKEVGVLNQEEWTIVASIKEKSFKPKYNNGWDDVIDVNKKGRDDANKTMATSDYYSFDEFKVILKDLNRKLTSDTISEDVFKTVKEDCKVGLNLKNKDERKIKVMNFILDKERELDIVNLENSVAKKYEKLKNDIKTVGEDQKQSETYLEMKEVTAKLEKLKQKVAREKRKHEDELNIEDQKRELRLETRNLESAQYDFNRQIDRKLLNICNEDRNSIKKDLEKSKENRARKIGLK